MQRFEDHELIDGFFNEKLTEDQKEAFIERATSNSQFLSKWIDRLEEETRNSPDYHITKDMGTWQLARYFRK